MKDILNINFYYGKDNIKKLVDELIDIKLSCYSQLIDKSKPLVYNEDNHTLATYTNKEDK